MCDNLYPTSLPLLKVEISLKGKKNKSLNAYICSNIFCYLEVKLKTRWVITGSWELTVFFELIVISVLGSIPADFLCYLWFWN